MRPSMPWQRPSPTRASRWRNTTRSWKWRRTILTFARRFVSASVLRPNSRSSDILDRTGDEDDALLQQTREDVVGALAPAGLLDHHGDKGIHVDINGVAHGSTCLA